MRSVAASGLVSLRKIFLPPIPGLGAEVFHPFNSLRPAQLNRFPINKTAGRGQEDFFGRAQPFADFLFGKKMCAKRWGLLFSAFFTWKIFHAADRREYELEKSVFLHGRGPDALSAGKMTLPRSPQTITK